jgi:hypothetical protein
VPIDTHELDVLVLLDLVPRALVTVTVPDDLRALREAVKVVASTHNGTSDNGDDREGLGGDVLLDLGEGRLSWSDICENNADRRRGRMWSGRRVAQ